MTVPQPGPPDPERRRAKKLAWRGYTLMGAAIVMFGVVQNLAKGDLSFGWLFVLLIGGTGLVVWVGRTGRRWTMSARKLEATSAAEILEQRSVRPVLYLRAFADDERVADAGVAQGFFQLRTEEEQLARVLDGIGPFVAIGDPKEELPDLGAARLYVSEEWKAVVIDLLARASLVVVRVASTEAVRWELQQVVSRLSPERIVLVVPKGRRRYRAVKAACDGDLRKPLPDLPLRPVGLRSVGGVVRFEPDWTPVFLPRARLRWLRGSVRGPLEQRLQYMLRPVFEQVGAEWQRPPTSLQGPAGLLGGLVLLGALYQGGLAIARAAGVG